MAQSSPLFIPPITQWMEVRTIILDTLHNLVPFLLFKKRENTHEGVLYLVYFSP